MVQAQGAAAAANANATATAVAVVGEALIDLIPVGGSGGRTDVQDLYQGVPGGSPANVAVGLARLGVPTRMAARVSGDPPGRITRRRLADAGVDLRGVVAAAEASSVALVSHGDAGPHYDLRLHGTADWQWTEAELQRLDPGSLAALHVGSLAAVLPPGAHEIAALVRRVRRTATITYDPNVRPEHMTAVPDARGRISALMGLADVVKLSDADLAWLAPGTGPVAFARHQVSAGAAICVVTLGAAGAVAACAAGAIEVPAVPVEVVDTVGAGDAYMSALLAGLHDHRLLGAAARADLRTLAPDTLATVLADAALAAAVTCGRRGSDPPTRAELTAPAAVR
ncbi:PfkB family carbohydrate kinase [Catenulispora pinisilvae]|uniref:PfkB family carbohydrate kinase n=1 Tax=Catenulispora pinisilvae TaxID=2705253 RepID=UPI00189275AC|nr:PfkB family carbohydrate kinase [Catenulispora pinisilvae]